jgi:ATP-binding cassette subfamily C protein
MKLHKDDYKNLVKLFKELFRISGNKVIVSFFLQILTGFTQGIGLLMLIPLLSLVGVFNNQVSGSKYVEKLIQFLQNTGIPEGIVTILFFYILIVSLNSWLNSYQSILNAKIQHRFVRFLKDRLYTSIGHSQWLFVSQKRLSDLAHEITSEVQRSGQVIFQILRYTSLIVSILVYVVVAFLLSAKMALLALIGAVVLLATGIKKNKYARDLGQSSQRSVKKVYQVVLEHLSGMKIAKSFAQEDNYISEFVEYSEEVEIKRIEYARLSSRTSLVFSIGTVVLLSIYVYLAIKVAGLAPSTLLVLIYIFSRLLPKVSSLQSSYQAILQSLPAFISVNQLQTECDLNSENLKRSDGSDNHTISGSVRFQNISFSYGANTVIKNLDLLIPANSIICITGASGSGKTTLADLLLGLLKPGSGHIFIDDQVLNEEILYQWRKSIGYVTQESFLFNDTIRNNLLWTKPGATDDELWDALEKASAGEMVHSFKLGLETVVGDRGAQLSGGERQRLALARALVRKPTLLLLDEATNALDPVNENKIIDALEKLKGTTTMVIISHSPEIHRIADQVVCIENGEISHVS